MGLPGHPYFRIERARARPRGKEWLATATVVRADTGEPVDHILVRAATPAAAEAQLDAEIQRKLADLAKPDDWGRDPTVFRLLQRSLQLRDELYGRFERANSASTIDAATISRDAQRYEQEEMKRLQQQVEALTEAQLIELVTPTADQLAHTDSPHVLDMLSAKEHLSRFILHRSPAVRAAHDRLVRALEA